jgi:VanZ family protein
MHRYKPHFVLATLALLIMYGSLYPFHYAPPESVQASLKAFAFDGRWWTSPGDEIGNVSLFVPLGAAAMIRLPGGRGRLAVIALLFLACVTLSFAIQVLQIYFPPREAALADVLSNSVGALIGMAGGVVIRRTMDVQLPHVAKGAWIALLILAAWMLGNLWPFVPSIDVQGLKDSLKPLVMTPRWSWTSFLFHLGAVYLVGEVVGSVAQQRDGERIVLMLIASVVVGKLLVAGQSMQPAFVIGTLVGSITLRRFRRRGDGRLFWLLGLLFATYTLESLLPFELRDQPRPVSWIPFASLLDGEMDVNAKNLGNMVYFFVGMTWLVARMHGRVLGIAVVLALWAAVIELAQCWLVGRTPDVTPPILALVAGLSVHLAVREHSIDRRARIDPSGQPRTLRIGHSGHVAERHRA